MKVLVAEDDVALRDVLANYLAQWGYEVTAVGRGDEALELLAPEDSPPLAVLDVLMPGLSGTELCRTLREADRDRPRFLLLLTSRDQPQDLVEGFAAGADDYLPKPFRPEELRARVRAGERIVSLELELTARVRELEAALASVHRLEGLLPICSYCKRVRDDRDYWEAVEVFVSKRSEARFSHGICPRCFAALMAGEEAPPKTGSGGS